MIEFPTRQDEGTTERLAIRGADGGDWTTLSMRTETEGRATVSLSGDALLDDVVRAAFDAVRGAASLGTDEPTTVSGFMDSLADELRSRGLEVRTLPDADFHLRMEIDGKGRVLARHQRLHDFGSPESDIGGSLTKVIAAVFDRDEEIAARIEKLLECGDHVGATSLALLSENVFLLRHGPSARSFDALLRIDRTILDDSPRVELLRLICALAGRSQRFADAEDAMNELLQSDPSLSEQIRFGLRNMLAVAAQQKGAPETALSIWQGLVARSDEIDAGERGWLHRNMAFAYEKRTQPGSRQKALTSLRASIDAFRQAGDRKEAAEGLGHLSRLLESETAQAAMAYYDEMLTSTKGGGILDDDLRAGSLHGRARRLLGLHRPQEASESVLEAIELRRGLVGAEDELISSLHLAALAAQACGDEERAHAFEMEARSLAVDTQSSHFAFGHRLEALMACFDKEEADALWDEARSRGDIVFVATVGVARVICDPDRSPLDRLAELETLVRDLVARGGDGAILRPARQAIASILSSEGDYERAVVWHRAIVKDQPIDVEAGRALVDALWRAGLWGDAAMALEEQIGRFGETADRLYALGRSQLEAGDASSALVSLSLSVTKAGDHADVREKAMALRERAFAAGATIVAAAPPRPAHTSVSLNEVQEALADFAKFVSSEKRMEFWTRAKGDTDHKWVSRPERFGQNLLHTFAKARFGKRATAIEEIAAGAGRLDLMLRFAGGLAVIVELKMCGGSYAASYARKGEDQVRHYMDNLDVHLGFLLVFDARIQENGNRLMYEGTGDDTVAEILVDVRPRIVANE